MSALVPRLGVTFTPTMAPETLTGFAQSAQEHGLDELWLWEDCFAEGGIAQATAALSATQSIRVVLGLAPVPLRSVVATAMEFATIARMFPGRFVPGLGHGVQSWMAQAGVRAASPLTLLREYTVAVRDLLAGREVTVHGDYVRLDGVKLSWPPTEPLQLMIGATREKTLALAGEIGDGAMLDPALTFDEIQKSCELVRESARAAGRDDFEIVASLVVATGPDAAARVDSHVLNWGHASPTGRGIGGDAADVAQAVRGLGSLGVASVAIVLTGDVVEPAEIENFVRFLGREVKPRLA